MEKPFLLSLLAIRRTPSVVGLTEDNGTVIFTQQFTSAHEAANVRSEISHWAHLVLAPSKEDAEQMGMEFALSDCPKDDGWVYHHAVAKAVEREFFEVVNLDSLTGLDQETEDSWPDTIF